MKFQVKFVVNLSEEDSWSHISKLLHRRVDVRLLLADALSNFVGSRTPAVDYVERHYQWMTVERRAEKVVAVQKRVDLVRYIQMEGLGRFEMSALCSCREPESPCGVHDHPDGTPRRV